MALPAETITTDIHCAMKRSKLVSTCCGVALDALLDRIVTAAEHLSVWSDGGYTTNPSIENFVDGNAGVVYKYDGDPLETEHGGPDGLLVPNLYFWKRAKWVRAARHRRQRARTLGDRWLSRSWRPVAAALPGRLTWRVGTVVELIAETPRTRSIVLEMSDWVGHRPGQHVNLRLTAAGGYQTQRRFSIASAPEDGFLVLDRRSTRRWRGVTVSGR